MRSRAAIPLCSLLTFPTLLLTEVGILDTPHSFSLHFHIVLAYAVFFCFGWGLYRHRTALGAFERIRPAVLLPALPCLILAAGAMDRQLAVRPARRLRQTRPPGPPQPGSDSP